MRLAATGVALLCPLLVCATAPKSPRRPNVLLLVMDTTRGDRCSFAGYQRPTTPHLAEFAKDAVVFRDAWSPAGWTGPAHASLFTGLRPENHGFTTGNRRRLDDAYPTLAEILAAAGYATGCFVNNDWISPACGTAQGFETFAPLQTREDRAYPWARETHALAAEWAEAEARAGRPFFLFVNDMEPHLSFSPSLDEARPFLRGDPAAEEIAAARNFDFPEAVAYSVLRNDLTPRQLDLLSDLYDAEIASLDREIGALLERLRADGLLDETIVVITGDHGELLGEHRMISHGFSLHRAARHVPLLVRFPSWFDGGRSVDSVARLEDVMPTILELCGLRVPPGLDGASLLRDLTGRVSIAAQGFDREAGARLRALVPGADAAALTASIEAFYDGRHHYISYSDGREELYDVAVDPDERHNLAASAPEVVARMRALQAVGR